MTLYDQDFYQWTQEQAALLKAGALARLDVENLIEEIESMGRSEKRELISRLAILIAHILKWEHQPSMRARSWENTIKIQRIDIRQVLKDSPGLKHHFTASIPTAYEKAVVLASDETNPPETAFPACCPYDIDDIMDKPFRHQ